VKKPQFVHFVPAAIIEENRMCFEEEEDYEVGYRHVWTAETRKRSKSTTK